MSRLEEQVRDVFRAVDAGDYKRYAEAMTPDCDFLAPGGSGRGPDAVIEWVRPLYAAAPDTRHEILAILAQDDLVAVELRVRGTHTAPLVGPAGEIPPTGRAFDMKAADIWRMDGDRIAAYHIYFDQMEMLGQLGLLPEPAATAG